LSSLELVNSAASDVVDNHIRTTTKLRIYWMPSLPKTFAPLLSLKMVNFAATVVAAGRTPTTKKLPIYWMPSLPETFAL